MPWIITDDTVAGTRTYTAAIQGNYNIKLGEAAITKDSAGSITVITTGSGWSNDYGIGVTSNKNPFNVQSENRSEHMSLYIGRPGYHTHACIEYHVNMNRYRFDGEAHDSTAYENHPLDGIALGTTHYSTAARDSGFESGQRKQLTFGFSLEGALNPDGSFAGIKFTTPQTYVTTVDVVGGYAAGTVLALDAYIETESEENSIIFPNLGGTFGLENLISYGIPIDENGAGTGLTGIPDDAWTYITIVKPLSEVVPEPATTSLSLLALVGLAARRRRK